MDTGSLPVWAQAASYLIISIGAALIGIFKYFKTDGTTSSTHSTGAASASVVSASFIDSKLLKELVEALRELQDEQGRDSKRTHRLVQDLREAINELNESIIVQTDTTMNLVRFINRETNKSKVVLGE